MINQEKINLAAQSSLKLRRDTRAEPKFEADIIDDFESPTSPYRAKSRQPSLSAVLRAKAGGGGGRRTQKISMITNSYK